MKPDIKPKNPCFSSGPCSKRPGYTLDALKNTPMGRSHRSSVGKKKLKSAIDLTRSLLSIPDDYLVGIVPGSDTGAFEMAMWSLLGPRGVDALVWEAFGKDWAVDITSQLKIADTRVMESAYGEVPDFSKVDFTRDVVFTWNGTTSGVKIPDSDWIAADRQGLTLCDATSAVFAMPIAWDKIDVLTFSWQKVLGGEGAHGMLVLSPRAVERLESHTPAWPMPKIFRLTKKGVLSQGIFQGDTINTPSMLCVEDYLDALQWVESIGGVPGLIKRSMANLAAFEGLVREHAWIDFLAARPEIRSNTSVCFTLDLPKEKISEMVAFLAAENVAFDCGAYRDAPPGLRFWAGGTIETSDVEALLPWIVWAYQQVSS